MMVDANEYVIVLLWVASTFSSSIALERAIETRDILAPSMLFHLSSLRRVGSIPPAVCITEERCLKPE